MEFISSKLKVIISVKWRWHFTIIMIMKWAEPREKGSSDFSSIQSFSVYAWPDSKATCLVLLSLPLTSAYSMLVPVAQSDLRPTGCERLIRRSQVRSPPGPATFFSWRLIMKYFLRSFSPVCWFKKGNCQCLAKECAQVLANRLEN